MILVPANGEASIEFRALCMEFTEAFPADFGTIGDRAPDEVLKLMAAALSDGTIESEILQTQAALWRSMDEILRKSYRKSYEKALRDLRSLMTRYDQLDVAEDQFREQLEAEREDLRPSKSKIKKLEAKLVDRQKQRKKLQARERELMDLGLILPPDESEKGT